MPFAYNLKTACKRQYLALSRLYLWKEPDDGLIVRPKPVANKGFYFRTVVVYGRKKKRDFNYAQRDEQSKN
jgi:hypothetical protein